MLRYRLALVVAALTLVASAAAAVQRPALAPPGAVALSGPTVRVHDPVRQRALSEAPAWQEFRSRHGDWAALWNEVTGTPHRAFGPSIPLDGYADDPAAVDRAVRRFVAEHPGIFGGAPALEIRRVQQVRDVWYVSYQQIVRGVAVLFSDWEFRVGANGRLMLFGADTHPVPETVSARPVLVGAVAREAARAGLRFDPATDRIKGGEKVYFLPRPTEDGLEYRLVYDVRVETADPLARWITLVDATTGEVLWRHDQVRYAIGGNVSGQVQLNLPTDAFSSQPFERENVNIGTATTVATDVAGNYSADVTGSNRVTSKLTGLYCAVNRTGGGNANFTHNGVANPATVNIVWDAGNSQDSERDGYYHVNVVHDFVKGLDPGFVGNDYAMPCKVDINDVCNAFWDGSGVNFYAAGGGCPNTATMPDVVYHEYGHGINDNLYKQAGAAFGMVNGALHEGMADVNAAFLQDNPTAGKGFFGPGTFLRTVDNASHWPDDRSGDPHTTGLIIAGAFWDLREAVGLALARQLSHFAKYGKADDPNDDGLAMNEFFLETLVVDDDDANLANGTPHFAAINTAFNAHGIGSVYYLDITHTPLPDQAGAGPYAVNAVIRYTPDAVHPFGALDPASPTLYYSINGAAWTPKPMAPTGNPDEYRALIPAVGGAIVRYYIGAADLYGGAKTDPPNAPGFEQHVFLTGALTQLLFHDQETDQGWTVGSPTDNATTGVWVRAEPVGTTASGVQVQPELDHTPDPGQLCWVTGNAGPNDAAGTNDVDGGKTTLTTPVFSAAGLTNPVVEYYRWYTNNAGADPGNDLWQVDISNDGGSSWVPVENTSLTDNSWQRKVLFVNDYVPPTGTMRVRFVAEDAGNPSLVEAAVDDFRLLSLPVTTAVGDASAGGTVVFRAPAPNPFASTTWLRYALPVAARVSLRLYDVRGRLIRTLESGIREAGDHAIAWDGRDQAGHRVGSGAYYARLAVGTGELVRTLVRLR